VSFSSPQFGQQNYAIGFARWLRLKCQASGNMNLPREDERKPSGRTRVAPNGVAVCERNKKSKPHQTPNVAEVMAKERRSAALF
jgi:hypothetical protein